MAFIPGTTYTLSYAIAWASGPSTCVVGTFTWPCCGAQIPSNLTVGFSITEAVGNGSLVFADTTGAYNSGTNPGGYGAPNPAYGDITSTLIKVTLENGTVINFSTFIPTSPTVNTFTVYTGTQCQVGHSNQYLLLYGNSQACIMGQIQALLQGTCVCADENCDKTDYVTKMLFELDAIVIAAQTNVNCVQNKIQAYYQRCSCGCVPCQS
jgi:hypothetical protein